MAHRRVRLVGAADVGSQPLLRMAFDAARTDFDVPVEFAPEVEAAAAASLPHRRCRRTAPTSPSSRSTRWGRPTSTRACISSARPRLPHPLRHRRFVPAGGPVDVEARRRGQTVYAPDRRTPLHPTVVSEYASSLLAGQVRPAYVWDLRLDADAAAGSGSGEPDDERLALLRAIGLRRIALQDERGGADLPLPEQEVIVVEGGYELRLRPPSAAEDWNAQISLMPAGRREPAPPRADPRGDRTVPRRGVHAVRGGDARTDASRRHTPT